MDSKKDTFTNEKLSKKFVSQFDLVNYAIRLAENMIRTGRDPRVKIESKNRAMQILAEINENEDRLDDVPEDVIEIDGEARWPSFESDDKSTGYSTGKSAEKKKTRKIFGA